MLSLPKSSMRIRPDRRLRLGAGSALCLQQGGIPSIKPVGSASYLEHGRAEEVMFPGGLWAALQFEFIQSESHWKSRWRMTLRRPLPR